MFSLIRPQHGINGSDSPVAVIHLYILILEMFLWDTHMGRKSADFSRTTKALAGNQGLYNGFLAAGIYWVITANKKYCMCRLSRHFWRVLHGFFSEIFS